MKEFDLINNIKSRYGLTAVGDDCAILPNGTEQDLLMTVDLLIESVDFELTWTTASFIGHKALAVSLSDVAAMGGTPSWAMLSLGIPEHLWNGSFLDEFYSGWHDLSGLVDVELIGGDISRSPDKLVIDSIVCGSVPRGQAIRRSGAEEGDLIFISGPLGGAAAGLKLLLDGERYHPDRKDRQGDMLLKQIKPYPQLELANLLRTQHIASSLIDISDGLSSDLQHLLEASNRGADLNLDSLPVDPGLQEIFDQETCTDLALNGGEDFELLFTCPPEKAELVIERGCVCIGSIIAGPSIIVARANGEETVIKPGGFQHF